MVIFTKLAIFIMSIKSKKYKKIGNSKVRGVSFPTLPFDVLAWAEKEAKKQNRNFSNYMVELVLQEKARKENNNG